MLTLYLMCDRVMYVQICTLCTCVGQDLPLSRVQVNHVNEPAYHWISTVSILINKITQHPLHFSTSTSSWLKSVFLIQTSTPTWWVKLSLFFYCIFFNDRNFPLPLQMSVRNCFIRGSVVRYVQLPADEVDTALLQDATRKEAAQGKQQTTPS